MMNGIIKENPTFVLLLGMCPTLGTNVGFSLIIPFIITLKLFISSTPFFI